MWMTKPMPAEITRAQAAAFLPTNIAHDLIEYLTNGRSGQFILNVQKGKILGARVEHVTKALDNAT